MGLYLLILNSDSVQTYEDFVELDDEVDEAASLDVGAYSDFGAFRDAVAENVEGGNRGSRCPTLMNHSDSDGLWSADDCAALAAELAEIKDRFAVLPPRDYPSPWMGSIASEENIAHATLGDSFIAVDGVRLVDGLLGLALEGERLRRPILFQ